MSWEAAKRGGRKLTEVAELPLPAVGTDALKPVHAVDAGASVSTRAAGAVVDVWKRQRCARCERQRGTCALRRSGGRTLVTVGAREPWIADTREVARWLADAASPSTAHVGGDVTHLGRVVGCYGNSAAVNDCEGIKKKCKKVRLATVVVSRVCSSLSAAVTLTRRRFARLLRPLAHLSLVAVGTGAVEVPVHAVARRRVLTRVRIAHVSGGLVLHKDKRRKTFTNVSEPVAAAAPAHGVIGEAGQEVAL